MFEDPQRLDDVTTVHGLKRYLHQQGLRLAFRLFRSQRGANHTVDLLVADERQVLRCEQVIRYLEFEPTPPVGRRACPSWSRSLARGLRAPAAARPQAPLGDGAGLRQRVPDLRPLPEPPGLRPHRPLAAAPRRHDRPRVLRGQPVRAGPASRPLACRGSSGCFASSTSTCPRTGCGCGPATTRSGPSTSATSCAKAGVLFDLLPYLMDVDWLIGDLDYPQAARAEVAAAWAGFFARWGVVPAPEVLSADRRKIVVAVEPDPAGPREVVWDGRGAYRDRFSGMPAGVARRDGCGASWSAAASASLVAEVPPPRGASGQRSLDQTAAAPARRGRGPGRGPGDAGRASSPRRGPLPARARGGRAWPQSLAEGGPPLAPRRGRWRRWRAASSARPASAPRGASRGTRSRRPACRRLPARGPLRAARRARASSDWPWRSAAACSTATRGPQTPSPGAGATSWTSGSWRARSGPTTTWAPGPRRSARRGRGAGGRAGGASQRRTPRRSRACARASASCRRPWPRPAGPPASPSSTPPGGSPPSSDGRVLLARAVRPEDTPWLRHAAGIVSTGGGILSHVGLVALELEKPAIDRGGPLVARPPRAPRCCSTGGHSGARRSRPWRAYQVVCRQELHDTEEALEQGDLVVVDGESGALVVLGHDAQALLPAPGAARSSSGLGGAGRPPDPTTRSWPAADASSAPCTSWSACCRGSSAPRWCGTRCASSWPCPRAPGSPRAARGGRGCSPRSSAIRRARPRRAPSTLAPAARPARAPGRGAAASS